MSQLLLPVKEAFTLIIPGEQGMTPLELKEIIEVHWNAQKAVDDLIHGEADWDTVGDKLEALGIDPVEWAIEVEENVEFLLNNV